MSNEKKPDVVNIAAETNPELVATAFHEAGHAVAAVSLGRLIQKVSIIPAKLPIGGRRLGACEFKKGRTKVAHDWLEDEVLILLGGMVAESHFTSRYCPCGAAQDLAAVRRLLATRAKNERQAERLERRMLEKAEHLLAAPELATAIRQVAQELLTHKTVSGRAVRHFCQQAAHQASNKSSAER